MSRDPRTSRTGHGGGARQQLADIQPDQRGGNQSYSGKNTEPAADIFGDRKGPVAFTRRQRGQFALLVRSHRYDMLRALAAEFALEPFAHDEECCHRLGSGARLGDHHHQSLLRGHGLERRAHQRGVHVVEDDQTRMRSGELALHRMWAAHAAVERPGAQRAAPDAHQADGVVGAPRLVRETEDLAGQLVIEGQEREAVEPVLG